jgi:DNA invertase Pin-like site-specific DNA recombinase
MPIRFVELIRVSSAGQAERDTPEDQRRALARLAEARPGKLVERIEHGAAGLSGAASLNDRPDLLRLAELSRAKAYDELRVRHVDRLTRHTDPRERFAIFGMVQDAGAVIVDSGGHVLDPTSEIGEVDYFLQTWASARERKKIVQRTLEARHRLSSQGRPMTTIPYGRTFNHETGAWGVDVSKAATYRRLFDDTIGGLSLHVIAEALNDEGTPAPRGGNWEASSVRRMLKASNAVGRMTSFGNVIECPPIVDEVTQKRAIDSMARGNTRKGPPAKHDALLRKIATCAVCNSAMHVHLGNRSEKPVLYYRCSRYRKPGVDDLCRTHHRIDAVDAAVIEALRGMLEDPDRMLRALERRDGSAGNAKSEAEAAEKELSALDGREEKLVRLHTTGQVSEHIYAKQQGEIARARAAARDKLDAATARLAASASAQALAADVETAVRGFRKRVARAGFGEWRSLVEHLFPRPGSWIRIGTDGTIETNGLLMLERSAVPMSLDVARKSRVVSS